MSAPKKIDHECTDTELHKIAAAVSLLLFTDGYGNTACRLVMEYHEDELRGRTGWCRAAVADQVESVLRVMLKKSRDLERGEEVA